MRRALHALAGFSVPTVGATVGGTSERSSRLLRCGRSNRRQNIDSACCVGEAQLGVVLLRCLVIGVPHDLLGHLWLYASPRQHRGRVARSEWRSAVRPAASTWAIPAASKSARRTLSLTAAGKTLAVGIGLAPYLDRSS